MFKQTFFSAEIMWTKLSFSIDNVISKKNKATKTTIKGCNFTAFFEILTHCVAHISRCPLLGEASLYLSKIKMFVRQQETPTGCFGVCWSRLSGNGEGERVRALKLTIFLITLSEMFASGDLWTALCGQNNKDTQGGSSNHHAGALHWPITWPPVKFLMFHADAPFWPVLTDCFIYLFFALFSDSIIFLFQGRTA